MTGFPLRGVRYYRCNGRNQVMDPEQRCRGSLQADLIEARIWAAVERVLQQPDMIAAEVAQYEATAGERRVVLVKEIAVIEAGLATCDREAQRWAEAYAAEVISLPELKEYRREIAARRQQLQVRQAGLHAELETIGQTSGQLESVMSYCSLVWQRLQTFDKIGAFDWGPTTDHGCGDAFVSEAKDYGTQVAVELALESARKLAEFPSAS